jgi:predicted nucleotidyltransferase
LVAGGIQLLPDQLFPEKQISAMLETSFIQNRLREVVTEQGVNLRYSCESGSRAWGVASKDSDYDVRFIYQHPREWYLQLSSPKDMIGPIMMVDGELDLVGWDLHKVLSHLAGSNAGVIEWLHSPVHYHLEEGFLSRLRVLAGTYFQPSKVAAHYLGIARSAEKAGYDEANNRWNLKKYCYFMRPVLAARYVINEQRISPVPFAELLGLIDDDGVRRSVNDLIALKQTVGEGHLMQLPGNISDYFNELRKTGTIDLENVARRVVGREEIEAFFRQEIGY